LARLLPLRLLGPLGRLFVFVHYFIQRGDEVLHSFSNWASLKDHLGCLRNVNNLAQQLADLECLLLHQLAERARISAFLGVHLDQEHWHDLQLRCLALQLIHLPRFFPCRTLIGSLADGTVFNFGPGFEFRCFAPHFRRLPMSKSCASDMAGWATNDIAGQSTPNSCGPTIDVIVTCESDTPTHS
jgi:hypothetical protein